jgi:hypothetical protein
MCNARHSIIRRSIGLLWSCHLGLFLLGVGLLSACSFHPHVPTEFAQYPRGWILDRSLKAMSPDGVLFTVRCEKNDPKAEMPFWREAMRTRMLQAGYRVIADTTCTMQTQPGRLLKLATPYGNQDYFYWIAFSLNPSGKYLLVAEAAGESKTILMRQTAIEEAISKSGWESK